MPNWCMIYKSNNANDAHLVKAVLEDHKINVVMVDKTDSMHVHLMNGEIELHIKPDDMIKAKHIISKNKL